MARVKFSNDAGVPRWGASKKQAKALQRERDLLNRIHVLEVALADERKLRETESLKLRQIEMRQAMQGPREKAEADALRAVCRIPFLHASNLGLVTHLHRLLEWCERIEGASR